MFKIGMEDNAGEVYLLRYQPARHRQRHPYRSAAVHKADTPVNTHTPAAQDSTIQAAGVMLDESNHDSQTNGHTYALGHDDLADDDAAAPWPLFSSSCTPGSQAHTQATHLHTEHAQPQRAQTTRAQPQHARTDSSLVSGSLYTNGQAMQAAQVHSQAVLGEQIAAHNGRLVAEPNGMQLHLAVYCLAGRRFVSRQEFIDCHRLIDLSDNAYVPMPPRLPPQQGSACRHEVCILVPR